MRVADVAGDAPEVRIALDKVRKHLVLLLVAGLERHAVLPVALAVVGFVAPQMVRLDAQQHVHIGQAFRAEVPRLVPRPQRRAEVAVKADGQPQLLRLFEAVEDEVRAAGRQCRRDAAEVQPVKAAEQPVEIDVSEVVLRDGAVLAVVGDLAGADAVAGL